MREKNIYVILRQFHKQEEDEAVRFEYFAYFALFPILNGAWHKLNILVF